VQVSLSCELLPEYRQYGHAMTWLLDGVVTPQGRGIWRIDAALGVCVGGRSSS
jgi:hypothetical protein